ncbi:hypothetical protein Vafri_13704, partial [Volvox africanus]
PLYRTAILHLICLFSPVLLSLCPALPFASSPATGSLDGLVEASRQARVCSGAANEVSATVFRVLMEEYGNGRLSRKHSTFYHSMMAQMGLDTRPEAYFDLVPWQWLACANHNFLMTERRRNYLRYLGGLTYFEVNGPSMYRTYCTAAQRQGLPPSGWGYWELHVREDERHGRQMVEEVAFPLIQRWAVGLDTYPHVHT